MTPLLQPSETNANLCSLECYCSADGKIIFSISPELYILSWEEEKESKNQLLLFHISAWIGLRRLTLQTGRKCSNLAKVFEDMCCSSVTDSLVSFPWRSRQVKPDDKAESVDARWISHLPNGHLCCGYWNICFYWNFYENDIVFSIFECFLMLVIIWV